MKVKSLIQGQWHEATEQGRELRDATTGEPIGYVSSDGIDFAAMLDYGRSVGHSNLAQLSFYDRALMLKQLALYLLERKDELYEVSYKTGATKGDSWIDIEGGIQTFFTYSGIGRREFPSHAVAVDGSMEVLSKDGSFVGRHILTTLKGVALHINAFNFPCWGMLEKVAPAWIAGMPCIVKPASATSYLTEKLVAMMHESGILPEGALQLVCGSLGDTFDHLTNQDVVTFTGSKQTADHLKAHPRIISESVRFNAEADSLNCSILSDELSADAPEIDWFVKEVVREMTVKSGQKCTAIRRAIVPEALKSTVIDKIKARLATVKQGDPRDPDTRMGTLAGKDQCLEVQSSVAKLKADCDVVAGGEDPLSGGTDQQGAFYPPTLLVCKSPLTTDTAHNVEAFGPVCTVMGYDSIDDAITLANKGEGSLVASIFTSSSDKARQLAVGIAPYHGRILVITEECVKTSTGHGSPLPNLIHGGPGRAGGGEELGGARAVYHYLQKTAIQGSPEVVTQVSGQWLPGAKERGDRVHPFRKFFEELEIGETYHTARRTITEADVVNFAGISGDFFYAHMDDIAAKESFFERRVAHGYFVLSAAAGLFVDPAPGPVLANYGLDNLRFVEPVYPGDTIRVRLTCEQKIKKSPKPDERPQGVVHWHVDIFNQEDALVATYTILTLVALKDVPC